MRYGITLDDVAQVDAVAAQLDALPRRVTVRIVFDEGQPATAYTKAVQVLGSRADIVGEILDSQYMSTLSVAAYADRTREYVSAFGNSVSIWEIGNEINGEWLGTTADVVAKMSAAYDVVKAAGKVTALTTYFNYECWSRADHEMLPWLSANVPARMKSGLDYVLVSYYEGDCNNYRPTSWTPLFTSLATMFPNSKLGFGEVGMSSAVTSTTLTKGKALMAYYYGVRPAVSRYIGGWFWWYGAEDVLGGSKLLLADFRAQLG